MKLFTIFFILITSLTSTAQNYVAQHLTAPKTFWQSFGYQNQIDHVQTVQYKTDSSGYEPVAVLVKSSIKTDFS